MGKRERGRREKEGGEGGRGRREREGEEREQRGWLTAALLHGNKYYMYMYMYNLHVYMHSVCAVPSSCIVCMGLWVCPQLTIASLPVYG